MSGNSILPETSTGSIEGVELEQTLYGMTVKEIMNEIYPVGSIYTSTESTNPSEKFGGEWERYGKGKTLVGVDEEDSSFNVSSKTGGSKSINLAHSHTVNSHTHTTKDHTLTIDEMPSHNHLSSIHGYIISSSAIASAGNDPVAVNASAPAITTKNYYTKYAGGGSAQNHGETTNSLSSKQSILNPYITVYIWKRVS